MEYAASYDVGINEDSVAVSYPRVNSWACRWTPVLRAPTGKPHAPSFLRRGFLRRLSARESERCVLRPRLRGWLTDSQSIRGLLPLMDMCYRFSRSQIKLTRFLPRLQPVGFRAVSAVTAFKQGHRDGYRGPYNRATVLTGRPQFLTAMSDGTSRTVDCPECGETFDPSAAGGWCTNPGCGEWQYDTSEDDAGREPAADGSGAANTDGDGADEHRDGTGDGGDTTGDADVPTGAIGGRATGSAGSARPDGSSASGGAGGGPACPDCGTAVEPDDSFCRSCGTDISHLAGGALTACPECGVDVEPADSFCRNCGENLDAHRSGDAGGAGAESERAGSNGRESGPESVVLTVRDREIQVTDGDTLGRAVRRIVVETGGDETDAVRIHREHVRFDREDGRFYLVDLAENPTVVNGQSLERGDRVLLSPGDRVELSNVARLRVRDA